LQNLKDAPEFDSHSLRHNQINDLRGLTGFRGQWRVGDVVRYSRGSLALGMEAGDYARVESVDAKTNQVTVRTDDKRMVNYDPRRLQGVTLYRETERAFATGDRVQTTAPDRERAVPNRELGELSSRATLAPPFQSRLTV
jgi:hypothetical protein